MILAANFKTNHTRASTRDYFARLDAFSASRGQDLFYIFPPSSALDNFSGRVRVGAQNAWGAQNGSFTGELGLEQLGEFGIKTILIGHSERRHIMNEGLDLVRKKFDFFKAAGFEIFFCIGEPLEVKERGNDAVMQYIRAQLDGIDLSYEKLVLAYEPVWAIGTGKSATQEDITQIHAAIKALAPKPLLYGGSVNAKNFKEIVSTPNVDGVLVGTASWNIDNFIAMLGV
ncbi:MAG: triose-phosphate isomerase [Helicobacteraceae bacterium]